MSWEVRTGLEPAFEALILEVEEATMATRVASALLLAQALGLDATNPVQAQKLVRHLALVERYVGGEVHD